MSTRGDAIPALLLVIALLSGGCEPENQCLAACGASNRVDVTGTFTPETVPTGLVEVHFCHQKYCVTAIMGEPLSVDETVSESYSKVHFSLELQQDGSVEVRGGAYPGPLAKGDSYAITIRDLDTGSILVEHSQTLDPIPAQVCGTPCPRAALCFFQAPGATETVACDP